MKGAYYPVTGLIAHRIVAKEDLHVGDRVATVADAARRAHNMRNHTATHLMNAALRNILGTHVKQAGSLVAPDHLRFDFSHFAAVDRSEIAEIEQQVNEEILRNPEVRTDIMNIDDALASGALAFFGDKYPEANVRVVTIPDACVSARLLQQGALRRHARLAHRRNRHFQDRRRAIDRRRRPPHRGHLGRRRPGRIPARADHPARRRRAAEHHRRRPHRRDRAPVGIRPSSSKSSSKRLKRKAGGRRRKDSSTASARSKACAFSPLQVTA